MAALVPGSSTAGDLGGLARGSALNLLGAFTATVANLGLVVVVTRGNSPTTAGAFFTVVSAFLLGSAVARLGTNTGLVFFVARSRAAAATNITHLLRLACLPVIAMTSVLAIAAWIWAPQLGQLLLGDDAASAVGMLRVMALALPAGVMHEVFLAVTRGYRQMAATVLIERIGIPVGQFLCLFVTVSLDGNATFLAIAWAAPYPPALVAAWWAWKRVLRKNASPSVGQSSLTAGTFWRFTAPRAMSSVAQLAMARADILLVAALRGPAEAALYTAATRFVVVGQLAIQALSINVQPRIAELASTADYVEAGRIYRVATTWLVLLAWPLYLTTGVFASQVLSIFGDSYQGTRTVAVVVIMSVVMLAATASGMVDVFLNMAGRSSWTLVNAGVALATMVGLDLLLIGPYGAVGAAVGWATAIAVRNTMALAMLWWGFRLHPFGRASGLAIAVSLFAFALAPAAGAFFTAGSLSGRIAGLMLGCVVFVVALVRWRVPLQTAVLVGQLKRRRGKTRASEAPAEKGSSANDIG
jgi:O-antigen/teichoic acid export membrane protein